MLGTHRRCSIIVTTSPIPPSNGKAWYRQALAYRALHQLQEAHAAAQQAAQCMPNATVLRLLQELTSNAGPLPACPLDSNVILPPLTGTYVPDSASNSNYNLLILLHGLGDNQEPFAQLARRMQLPDTACLALGGPEQVPETGGRAWFAVEWVDDDEGGSSVQVCVKTGWLKISRHVSHHASQRTIA